jgi:hypothetical protein
MSINTSPFVRLGMGESFIMFPEDNVGTVPVTSEKSILRSYSPFVIYAEPPPIIQGKGELYNGGSNVKVFTQPNKSSSPSFSNTAGSTYVPYIPTAQLDAPIGQATRTPFLGGYSSSKDVAIDMVQQYNALAKLPPIVFLINPSSFSTSYTTKNQFSDRTRYGYVYQTWGEDQPEVSITGLIGGFYAGRLTRERADAMGNLKGVSGLQFAAKRDSGTFRWLMSLLGLYRNSCAIVDNVGRSETYHAVGYQVIIYDGRRLTGRMTAFGYGYDVSKPHGGTDFSITFKVFKEEYLDTAVAPSGAPLENPFEKRGT